MQSIGLSSYLIYVSVSDVEMHIWNWQKRKDCVHEMTIYITHTIRQPEIPTLLDSWVTNTASVKMLCP